MVRRARLSAAPRRRAPQAPDICVMAKAEAPHALEEPSRMPQRPQRITFTYCERSAASACSYDGAPGLQVQPAATVATIATASTPFPIQGTQDRPTARIPWQDH